MVLHDGLSILRVGKNVCKPAADWLLYANPDVVG
jgi:hypothetical protein